MAIKGLSTLVIAKHSVEGSTVTYTDPTVTEKLTDYSISITSSDNNPFYADDMIAEEDKGTFQKGELTIGTAGLSQENSILILGLTSKEVSYGQNKTVKETIYDDARTSPYLGVGLIETHQINGKTQYKAIWLTKVFFNVPEGSATTKGESIEWQKTTITGNVGRSEQVDSDYDHPWRMEAFLDTKEEAIEYLKFKGGKNADTAPKVK